ncbi:hypothetical protein [Enterobacter huaxiensis]|uniref:hypothetical protein n=1 Tax=Enterobacter huaxiensis TaxID=2494702 RepID=UPI002953A9FC|nr:hypothetical protein [Enterobacter huaxiensis]
MSDSLAFLKSESVNSDWFTINEAVKASKNKGIRKIKASDIYRYALQGKILLSIYFQSPITLRKIKSYNHKLKLKPKDNNLPYDKITLNEIDFFSESNLTFSTEGEYFHTTHGVIDTNLYGYEFFFIQCILAQNLKIPPPVLRGNNNYGITVSLSGENFLVHNRISLHNGISLNSMDLSFNNAYLPIYNLPKDACFVIRQTELNKLFNWLAGKKISLGSFHTHIIPSIKTILACL